MKANFVNEDVSDTELFTLASQFYVRLRRVTGRVVDAVYIVQNEIYAREMIQLARAERDMELQIMASRLEEILGDSPHTVKPSQMSQPAPVLPSQPVVSKTIPFSVRGYQVESKPQHTTPSVAAMDIAAHSADEVAQHYIGALR